jgi:hypothetical protein
MSIFSKRPYPRENKQEIDQLIAELIEIGKRDDYLSERPGHPFNIQCRHIRARAIGERLNKIGGFELMEFCGRKVRKKVGAQLYSHLEYAWAEIGDWLP